MVGGPDVSNEVGGTVVGPVVQAGVVRNLVVGSRAAHTLPTPRQLPPALPDFAGRRADLSRLDDLLPAAGVDATTVAAVHGTAGVGKTTLVVQWAHRVQHRHFPDGSLFADLRGHGPSRPLDPALVLAGFLRALGTPDDAIPADVDDQASLYRSLLSGRRTLVVLDNAAASRQVRPLLPATPGSLAVVTSRVALTGLAVSQAAHRVTLGLFSAAEARSLVRRVIGDDRVDAEPRAVDALVEACARLPLALRVATTRIAARPHTTVADVVADITDEEERLDALSDTGDDHSAVRTVFDWSYARLSAAHARTFRRLGLHPGTEVGHHAVAALTGLDPHTARRHLEALVDLHLVAPVSRARYRVHDLLHAYAADRAEADETPEDRRRALVAVISWYARAATVADGLLFPGTARLERDVGPTAVPVPAQDRESAAAWMTAEHTTLWAAQRKAAALSLPQHVIAFAGAARFLLLKHRTLWTTRLEAESLGIEAAVATRDRDAEALLLMRRADSHQMLGNWADSDADLHRELALAHRLGDPVRRREALTGLGRDRKLQHRYVEALEYYLEALPLARQAGAFAEAVVECNLSQISARQGRFDDAPRHAEREVVLRRLVGSPHGEAYALHDVAVASQGLGDHRRAVRFCSDAVALHRGLAGTERDLAAVLSTMAASQEAEGDTAGAAESRREATEILTGLGDPTDGPPPPKHPSSNDPDPPAGAGPTGDHTEP
ncbi:MAG: hypothetical protein HOY78_20650 [Saccharothrix sp.]|nr:hypothetical protein [Saccharothrix sp.]